jgi:hypothetical protein
VEASAEKSFDHEYSPCLEVWAAELAPSCRQRNAPSFIPFSYAHTASGSGEEGIMISTLNLLGRLFAIPVQRDGQAELLERQALGVDGDLSPPHPAALPTPAERQHGGAVAPRRMLDDAIASKTLDAWLQNRQQTLFPLTLNFRIIDPKARGLLVSIAAASALAGGAVPTAVERERLSQELTAAGAGEAEQALLQAELDRPVALPPLLLALQGARLGAHAYAASLLALDRRVETSRAWLGYLAARLDLPPEIILGLHRRRRWRR